MKKILLIATIGALLVGPSVVYAQVSDDATVQANVLDFIFIAVSSATRDFGNVTPDSVGSGTDVGDVTVTNPPTGLDASDLEPFGNIFEKDDPVTVLVISTKAYNIQISGTKSGTSNLPLEQLKIVDDDDPSTPQSITTTATDLADTGALDEQAGFKWDQFDFRLTVAPMIDANHDDNIDLSSETTPLSPGTYSVTVTFTVSQT